MISFDEFIKTIKHIITDSNEYGWKCYGNNARFLTSEKVDLYTVQAIYDSQTLVVYEVTACDYINNRAYRLCNSEFKTIMIEEANSRNVNPNEAWDEVNYVDLDVEKDWLEKVAAIIDRKDYDERVMLNLDIDKDLLFKLLLDSHNKDMTFNNYVVNILSKILRTNS